MRLAGILPTSTVGDPMTIGSGIPGGQIAMSEIRDAGIFPTRTVGKPVVIGPPPWAGQTCESPIRAPGKRGINAPIILHYLFTLELNDRARPEASQIDA